MSYTLFTETEALPPIISECTNYMTGKFIVNWDHLQISRKLFRNCHGLECGKYNVFNEN